MDLTLNDPALYRMVSSPTPNLWYAEPVEWTRPVGHTVGTHDVIATFRAMYRS